MQKLGLALAMAVLLAACGSSVEGTYADEAGVTRDTFKSNGKVSLNTMGVETELDYSEEDGKVKLGSPQGALVMSILEDGSLQGPMGIKLVKQKK